LASSYAADTTVSGFHFVITALVAASNVILFASHPLNWLNQSHLKAILTLH
jgi:hypothetical protein